MKKFVYLFMLFFLILFFNCQFSNSNSKNSDLNSFKKYIIEDMSGNEILNFEVDESERVVKTQSKDSYGVEQTRSYYYENNNLQTIKMTDAYGNTKNFNFYSTINRSTNKIESKVLLINSTRSESDKVTYSYYYDEKGNVLGISSIDSSNNETFKGGE